MSMVASLRRTALTGEHERLGARMVAFHGWTMPLYYQGILDEHRCVRERVGLFDVSHMGQVYISGDVAGAFMQLVLTTDVGRLEPGRGQYSLMLNEDGGILDDVILFQLGEERYLLIVNAATRERDVAWLTEHAGGRVLLDDVTEGHTIIAIQGPRAGDVVETVLKRPVGSMPRFALQPIRNPWSPGWISRSGYTGSDGFELFLPNAKATEVWRALMAAGAPAQIQPIGLGARDSLRLEAGLRLYGTDMTDATTPDEAGLSRLVAMEKGNFLGRAALARRRAAGVTQQLVGMTMLERGAIPRAQCPIHADGRAIGRITSGSMSPVLGSAIALGCVEPAYATRGQRVSITIRDRAFPAEIVTLPFVTR